MKHAIRITLLSTMLGCSLAYGQEYEARSEFAFCSLNDGKTMQDVVAQSEKYGVFSKEQGTKYMQAILTPMHAGDASDYDYIIWGTWPDGKAMYDEWGSYANDYGGWAFNSADGTANTQAGTCHRSIAVFNVGVVHNRIPEEARDKKQPVQFAQCSMKEGVKPEQLYAQAQINKSKMDEAGFAGWGIHYLFPYMGFDADLEYDFVLMNHWYSFAARGDMANAWGDFVEANPDVASNMRLLMDCRGSDSFVAQFIFNNM